MGVVVLGAGAWGTALAVYAAKLQAHRTVYLWSQRLDHCEQMTALRGNPSYLPGVAFPSNLAIQADFDVALERAELILIATPMLALRAMLEKVLNSPVYQSSTPVVWLCKGFEQGSGLLGHEILSQIAPKMVTGVFSGPSFAQEVARAQPTAMVIASDYPSVCDAVSGFFHSSHLRVYHSQDVVGTEVGGAVKNVLAIAAGLCDGLQLGLNARAALITRGLAEITRLGVALGGQKETFMGLTGLGDLVLTTTGDLSRNRQVGLLLAQGQSLTDIQQSLGHVAEGVYSAHTVLERAHSLGVDMPISQAVVALLSGKLTPQMALQSLMGRDVKQEVH